MWLMNQEPYGKLLIITGTGFTKLKPKSTQVLAWLQGGKSAFLFLLLIFAIFTDGHGLPVDAQILQWNTPNFPLLVSSTKKGEISRSPLLPKALRGFLALTCNFQGSLEPVIEINFTTPLQMKSTMYCNKSAGFLQGCKVSKQILYSNIIQQFQMGCTEQYCAKHLHE